MTKKVFTCKEASLSHSDMLELRNSGMLNLGIDNRLAVEVANARGAGPTKTTAVAAHRFWTLIALGVFLFGIYLSFTSSWWWFIPGIIVMTVIWNANKKSTGENFLDAAMIDQEFYERVRGIGGWLYEMEESTAERFKVKD
jgi:hypothetical protein